MTMGGDAQVGQSVFIHNQQHGNVATIVQPLGNLLDTIIANAVGIEHEQVEVVCRGRRIGSRAKTSAPMV